MASYLPGRKNRLWRWSRIKRRCRGKFPRGRHRWTGWSRKPSRRRGRSRSTSGSGGWRTCTSSIASGRRSRWPRLPQPWTSLNRMACLIPSCRLRVREILQLDLDPHISGVDVLAVCHCVVVDLSQFMTRCATIGGLGTALCGGVLLRWPFPDAQFKLEIYIIKNTSLPQ